MAYMVYRLIALYEPLTGNPATDPYFFSRKTMTVFGRRSSPCLVRATWDHTHAAHI